MATAIEVRDLSKTFGRRCVLKEVSFVVAAGQSIALVGANGSGKTTLLRCLASVIRPTSGEVRWFGRRAIGDADARRLIGMVAHESRLYPHLTLRENLLFAARMHDVHQPAQRADSLLEELGLQFHMDRTPNEISKGMRQRLSLARAMIHEPQILFLDEPFAGLDSEGVEWLGNRLAEVRDKGHTLCFSEHDPGRVLRLAHRVFQLRPGNRDTRNLCEATVCEARRPSEDGRSPCCQMGTVSCPGRAA